MAGRRKTKRSRTSSSGVDDHLKNSMSSSLLMEVCARSAGKMTKVEGYCESGLDLWVDLKIDSNPENDLDHSDLPLPIASPQGSSTSVQLSDLGPQPILGSSFDTDERGSDLLVSASPDAHVSKIKISERASDAMEELLSLALAQEPFGKLTRKTILKC
ncbi:hypothetical protein GBA52_014052 [Prunus armeniaca]|nr:hypothetical protein GBA52_014052 [Prunus armeniaca]